MKTFAIVFTALMFCGGCVKKAEKPAAADAGAKAEASSDAVAAPSDAGAAVVVPVEVKAEEPKSDKAAKPEKEEKPSK